MGANCRSLIDSDVFALKKNSIQYGANQTDGRTGIAINPYDVLKCILLKEISKIAAPFRHTSKPTLFRIIYFVSVLDDTLVYLNLNNVI